LKIKNIYLCFVLFLLFAVAAYFIRHNILKEPDYQVKTDQFVKELRKKESLVNTLLEKIIDELKTQKPDSLKLSKKYYADNYRENEVAIIVSKKDSVVFWSTNAVPVEDIIVDTLYISEIFHLSNGWYEVREKRFNDYLVRGAILIKREYKYQNDYLKTEFQKDFSLPDECKIQLFEGEYNVFSSEGYLLCSLIFPKTITFQKGLEHLAFVCFTLAFIFFISFLILFFKNLTEKLKYKALWIFLTGIFILGLRYFFFCSHFPGFIYTMDVFGPKYYANSEFLPSLGDLLMNSISIFLVCVFFFKSFRKNQNITTNISVVPRMTISAILLFIIPLLFTSVFKIIKGLILNSSLIFDLNNIFSLDFYSIFGLISVSFILLSFFLLSFIFAESAYVLNNEKHKIWLTLSAISFVFFCLLNSIFTWINWYYAGIIIILIFAIGFYLKRDHRKFTFQAIALYIVMFSLLSTYCFYEYNTYKEREKRKLLASQLAVEQDPIAEYLFNDVEKKIASDTTIKKIINSDAENKEIQIAEIVQKNYLNGYWLKYNLNVIVCPPGQVLNLKPENIKTDCDSFFQSKIKNEGIATQNSNFFFINDGSGRNSYLARIPFNIKSIKSLFVTNLYVELDSKYFDKEQGYPELLIDKDIKINRDLYNYSYVKYKNNQLLLQYGKYYYSLNASNYHISGNNEFTFFEKDEYDHLFYKIDPATTIIISKKSDTLLSIIAPFSYIFIFYCICVLAFLFLLHFPMKKKEISMNFKSRIQISMVSVLIVSFVIIGASTLYYITNLYDKKNLDNLGEKAHSVLIEVEDKLGSVSRVTPDMKEDIADLLTRFSNVFFTDINLYTPGGLLVASSRPQVFDEGMISRKMDSKAFNELSSNKKTLYIHEENIGKLNYISAYVPFRNNDNELIGYINLPYFAKQSELKKEISTFLIAFININVILTALAIIIALLVSNYITRPMKLIKDKLSQLKLGKKNEKIDWVRNDEIGGLISDYNRMIDELAESAELLAKSERESAWREMAKQVAHEIKNPLTPMKLSIQLLKKSWEDHTPDWDIRLEKFTYTMIEQIESLSRIASEFSDFAKMPRANNENIDLISLIESVVILYQDNKQMINFVKSEMKECFVLVDKTQILRVFNNLLKNSIQAINLVEKGKIDIIITKEGDYFIIKISDNGVGIAEEQKEKIFSPNFTTKTGGMGLGLAMVKSIIESYKGKIWFESQMNKGTTFFVSLPVVDNLD